MRTSLPFLRRVLAVVVLAGWSAMTHAQQPAPSATTATIRGTVFDSLETGRYLSDADVFLDGADRAVRTDSRGRFALENVPAGTYRLAFYHASLDAIGVQGPVRSVTVTAGQILDVELFTPGREAFYVAACSAPPDSGLGVLLGTVTRGAGPAATPAARARLVAGWTMWTLGRQGMRQTLREAAAMTDASGAFKLCGVPNDIPVLVRTESAEGDLVLNEISLSERVVVQRRFALPEAPDASVDPARLAPRGVTNVAAGRADAGRGTAVLAGTVRTPDGRPVSNAQVALPDLGIAVNTPADGSFVLQGLPGGPRWVEIRAIGFRPLRARAALAEGKVSRLAATFDAAVTVLATLKVLGARASLETTGFEQRRRTGSGVYLTADDIEKRRAYSVNDLFAGIPGVEVRLQGMSAVVVISRAMGSGGVMANRCDPVWFVDGVRFRDSDFGQQLEGADISSRPSFLDNIIRPAEIAGIEVYKSLSSAPPQYQPLDSGCGVILVWTKRRPGK
jgi:hypothetical protein